MAFREVNPKKLAILLTLGTHVGELKKFFTESKTQLLIKGAKVQNLPHGREERVRTICEKLPRKTDDILRGWFQQNVSVAIPVSLDEVLMYLEARFNENEPLPETEAQVICRSALMYLFVDAPDTGLLRLLQGSPGASALEGDVITDAGAEFHGESAGESAPSADSSPSVDASAPQNYHLAELLASIIGGDESAIDNALAPFADGTRGLVEALLRLRSGDDEAAKEQLLLLPDGPESELVRSALARARHQRGANIAPIGIRAAIPQPLTEDPDTDTYEIIGIYSNETDTGAVFVQPLCLILGGQLRQLSTDDRIRLFPKSGSVMTHKPALRRPLKRRELVHWSVSKRDGVEGNTWFHLADELNPPIEVVRMPVPSSDADEVRDRIKLHAATGRAQPGQQQMFLLSDGVVVASPKRVDFARDEAFDQPWRAWGSLETWLIEGHQYCLDASQGTASYLDLSPLDAAFRRLLKNLDAEQKLTISRAQRQEIADLLRSQSGGEIAQRAKRIAAFIDQISINEEELELVLRLLGSHAEVRHRVDELIAKEFEARQLERAGLQGEISALKKKKTDLEKEGRDIERRNRAQADSVASIVRETFGRAIDEGLATMANAEIVRFVTGATVGTNRQEPAPASDQLGNWIKRGALSATDVKTRLTLLGINGRRVVVLSALLELAGKAGAALILKGGLARQCAQVLIRQDRDAVAIVDIPMGLTSTDFLHQHLKKFPEVQGLALLNADLAPFEVYGAELLDLLMDQTIREVPSPKPIVLSCLDGDLSLPLPETVRRVSLLVDLDSNWDDVQQRLEDMEPEALLLFPTLRQRMLEMVSTMDESLRQHVERALVKGASVG